MTPSPCSSRGPRAAGRGRPTHPPGHGARARRGPGGDACGPGATCPAARPGPVRRLAPSPDRARLHRRRAAPPPAGHRGRADARSTIRGRRRHGRASPIATCSTARSAGSSRSSARSSSCATTSTCRCRRRRMPSASRSARPSPASIVRSPPPRPSVAGGRADSPAVAHWSGPHDPDRSPRAPAVPGRSRTWPGPSTPDLSRRHPQAGRRMRQRPAWTSPGRWLPVTVRTQPPRPRRRWRTALGRAPGRPAGGRARGERRHRRLAHARRIVTRARNDARRGRPRAAADRLPGRDALKSGDIATIAGHRRVGYHR